MNPLVSIVVPIYKVEQWLPKCLDSCIHQTYDNIQILAVNDGSPDGCKEIIQQYSDKDPRVVLVDKPNGGLNSAREAGIKQATGEYLTILDGDDYLELNAIEVLLAQIQGDNPDVVIARGQYVLNETDEILAGGIGGTPGLLRGKDYLKRVLLRGPFTVCMKLYRTSLIKEDTLYPNIKASQDLPVTVQWAHRSSSAVFTRDFIYNYVMTRPGAVTSGDKSTRIEGGFDSLYFTFEWMSQNNRFAEVEKEFIGFLTFRLYCYCFGKNNFKKNKLKMTRMVRFIYTKRNHIVGGQLKALIMLMRINVLLGHPFVRSMQTIKPTFDKGFHTYL